ncbi:MAG: PKD domain-containing protein, partial [Frankiaceae bacterium]|nr:PKD domain-containing protein [Frankiaceae bacterium]
MSGAAPLRVTFDGSQSEEHNPRGHIADWTLRFGDGKQRSGAGAPPPRIPHVYHRSGIFDAQLRVTNALGRTARAAETITVAAAPKGDSKAPVPHLSAAPQTTLTGIHKIQHVVVIMQENRS